MVEVVVELEEDLMVDVELMVVDEVDEAISEADIMHGLSIVLTDRDLKYIHHTSLAMSNGVKSHKKKGTNYKARDVSIQNKNANDKQIIIVRLVVIITKDMDLYHIIKHTLR